jgi:4'-phosphopantetheinyl transferase
VREILLGGAVLLLDGAPRTGSAGLIASAASRVLGLAPSDLVVTHSCSRCGSDDHGRPRVRVDNAASDTCAVSYAASGGYAIAAARAGDALGVDIESIAAVSAHQVDNVLLHPAERKALLGLTGAERDRHRARLWVAKEAVAKLTGAGLRMDVRDIRVRVDDDCADAAWPAGFGQHQGARVYYFAASAEVIGALAVPGGAEAGRLMPADASAAAAASGRTATPG